VKARDAYENLWMRWALPILENLYQVHLDTLREAGMYDEGLESKLRALFESYFPLELEFPLPGWQYQIQSGNLDNLNLIWEWLRFPTQSITQPRATAQEQRFIGYGEVMSAHVLSHILDTRYHVANSIIDHEIESEGEWDLSEILRDEVGRRVANWLQDGIVIVPWYVWVHGESIIDAYGRGYTDKMAERIAVGLANLGQDPILHIQKQVPLLSSNPNFTRDAEPIENLSYWSAAEITGTHGANAQVLNGHTISRELAENHIPVWVYNPFIENGPRSVISEDGNPNSGIQFVDGRDHLSTITVSGFAMSWPGLLSRLTEFFTRQWVAIDSISSSETEVTFTTYNALSEFDRSEIWSWLGHNLGNEYTVNINNNLGMIYCIGDNLSWNPGLLEEITWVLGSAGVDIECITQSRGQRAVTIGVSSENLRRGVELLHNALIKG
jgi:aspartokinase/homoserine dehydrogenase 1